MRPRSNRLLHVFATVALTIPVHASIFFRDGADTAAHADVRVGIRNAGTSKRDTLATAGADFSGNVLNLTAVPEPGAALLGGLGLLALLRRRR